MAHSQREELQEKESASCNISNQIDVPTEMEDTDDPEKRKEDLAFEMEEPLQVVNTSYEIYQAKYDEDEFDSEEKFDTCSEASHNNVNNKQQQQQQQW